MKKLRQIAPGWLLVLCCVAGLSAQETASSQTPAETAAIAPVAATNAPLSYKHSIDIDLMASLAYKASFGLNSPESKFSYSPMLTYSYLLDANNSIGIILLKFTQYPVTANPVYNFAYGFQFRHSWHREWADLGIFEPWLSYGILLNWAVVSNVSGAVIGHDTRIALGTDLILAPQHRLVLQCVWDSVNYPALGTSLFEGLGSFSFGLGYRLLF